MSHQRAMLRVHNLLPLSAPAFREGSLSSVVYHMCMLQPLQKKERKWLRERRCKEKEHQRLGPSY